MNNPGVVIDDSTKRMASRISAAANSGPIRFDPTGGYARQALLQEHGNKIVTGLVIRSGCGSYDCSVKVGKDSIACMVLSKNVAQTFGISAGSIPVAGSYVLVLLIGGSTKIGYILGTIPLAWRLAPNKLERLEVPASYPNGEYDAYGDVERNKLPFFGGPKHSDQVWSSSNRPRDIHPGESTEVNENRVGVTENMYSVELSGGASYVRVSRLDDEIRMRSTNFQKWTDQEFDWEFNDGGLISAEGRNYSYQGELLGSEGTEGPDYKKWDQIEDKEPRPRTRWWKGFLGNLFSWFVVRARKTKEEDDETLVSVHASQGGNIMVRSTGGISLERYPRIPVPKRLKQPWDPEGDKEVDVTHKPFEPFTYDDPHARGLVEASRMAWEQKTMYQRFDELKKDFKVPNEKDVKVPGDQDQDPADSKEIEQEKYKDRRAGVYTGEDGSLILRDAWGSEVVMVGGNIIFNTPGNVIMTANRDIVSIARKGIILRGTEAVEISSEEGDARVHARKLLTMAGGTDKTSGGVLIESLAKGPAVAAPPQAGQTAVIGGVVVRSKEAGVLISGKNAYVNGEDNVLVWGGPDGGEREGNVLINGKVVVATGKDLVAGICKESSFLATEDAALLLSNGSSVVYGDSAMIINGDQIPILWSGSVTPPDLSQLKEIWKFLQNSEITEPYDWDNVVENALFSFRTAVQAKTNEGIEPFEPNKTFTLYEPYWQVMQDTGDPMSGQLKTDPHTPKVESVHGSKCWPYKGPIDDGNFCVYADGNVEEGLSKNRDELKPDAVYYNLSMSEFKI